MRGAPLLVALLGCGPRAAPEAPAESPRTVASAGVSDPELAALLEEAWASALAASPETATRLGLPGHDAEVAPTSFPIVERARRRLYLAWAAQIAERPLDARDRAWLERFVAQAEIDDAMAACRTGLGWNVSANSNPMADLWAVLDVQPLEDHGDARDWLARLLAWADASPGRLAQLHVAREAGLFPSATSLSRVIHQVEAELATPVDRWGPSRRLPPADAPWAAEFLARRAALLDGPVRAALVDWRDALVRDLRPDARSDEAPGLASLALGAECYAASIRAHTTLPLTADELHQTGLAELRRVHDALRRLGPEVFGTADLREILDRLRTDPALAFADGDAIVRRAEAILDRVRPQLPRWFGRLPETPVRVQEIPAHEAPYIYVAYYRQPSADGDTPGTYFVNTYRPETRRTYEAQALAFHEAIPGHHLQLALAYEQPDAPAFHRFAYQTAFTEGWALYAEGLADEMGLYDGDVDRLGMFAFDAWRAARLVVDTGLHDRGWSRAQAIDFLLENTAITRLDAENEVDRYVTWPGQALAYKVGQLEISRLRREAEEALGEAFDVRAFHDVVLGEGSLPLPALRRRVDDWLQRYRSSPRGPLSP